MIGCYPRRVTKRWDAVAWSLVGNAILLVGVLAWRWPSGNVLALFWVENVLLGVLTVAMILSARGTDAEPAEVRVTGATKSRTGPVPLALFFCFHYGLFSLVHLMFVAVLAGQMGLELSMVAFGVPVILIAFRYLGEFINHWVLAKGRDRVGPSKAMGTPYPRLIVLHLVTILAWGIMLGSGGLFGASGHDSDHPLVQGLRALGINLEWPVVVVLLLVVAKTLLDAGVSFMPAAGRRTRASDFA